MLLRAGVIWGAFGLVAALVIDFVVPEGVHLWLYGGFGLLAGGGSWGLCNVKRIPQGLAVGVIVGLVVGLLDGTLTAVASSPGILHPGQFVALKYIATVGLFAFLGSLPWSLHSL